MIGNFGGYYDLIQGQEIGDAKASYQSLLQSDNLAALLGGSRDSNGEFYLLEQNGYYWSASERIADSAWYYYFLSSDGEVYRVNFFNKEWAFSVRCLKD